MKNYTISQVKETGVYFRGDTLKIKIRINDIETNALTDPSNVDIEILDPCGESDVTDDMESDASGFYYYDYPIVDDAQYGIYDTIITTTEEDSLTHLYFVVFPWDICSNVRLVLSAYQQNDISDYKLALIAWDSYKKILNDIYEMHNNEKPLSDPDTNEWFNGTNKRFQLKNYPIADHNGDEEITGFGELDCGEDVTFHYIDEDGNDNVGEVSVIDAGIGLVELTCIGGTAVPDTIRNAYVKYWSESFYYDKDIMREAVAYLTAYKVAMTYKSLNKATLADIQINRELDAKIFKDKYEELIGSIGFDGIGCGK
jgi:hypothetical protein